MEYKRSRQASRSHNEAALLFAVDRARAKSPSHLINDASFNYTEKLNAYLAEKRIKVRIADLSTKQIKKYYLLK